MALNQSFSIYLPSACYVPDNVPSPKPKKTPKSMFRNRATTIVFLLLTECSYLKKKVWQGCYTSQDIQLNFLCFYGEVERRNEKNIGRIYIILGWQHTVPVKNWLPGFFFVYSPSHPNSSLRTHLFIGPQLHPPLDPRRSFYKI